MDWNEIAFHELYKQPNYSPIVRSLSSIATDNVGQYSVQRSSITLWDYITYLLQVKCNCPSRAPAEMIGVNSPDNTLFCKTEHFYTHCLLHIYIYIYYSSTRQTDLLGVTPLSVGLLYKNLWASSLKDVKMIRLQGLQTYVKNIAGLFIRSTPTTNSLPLPFVPHFQNLEMWEKPMLAMLILSLSEYWLYYGLIIEYW